ncbi:MAG: helix-turn-helix transcriptional regulator [Opitutaceae bacterium]|nr:helix-turn-helix transcriptional regulator [Opitutaceae bacterium]
MPRSVPEKVLLKLGENVRSLRERATLTQEELAAQAEVDRTYVGGLERGERNATIQSLARVAKALGTSVAELCRGIEG